MQTIPPRIGEALTGLNGPDQQRIATTGLDWLDLLLRKNAGYGSTVWQTPKLCPGVSAGDAILTRMSDKIDRLISLLGKGHADNVGESVEDTIRDLGGYCLLYLARPKSNPTPVADEPKFKVGDCVLMEGVNLPYRVEKIHSHGIDLVASGGATSWVANSALSTLTHLPPEKKAAAEPRFKVGDKVVYSQYKGGPLEVVGLPKGDDPFYALNNQHGTLYYSVEQYLTPTT